MPLTGTARKQYLARALASPQPDLEDELEKLGFQGASELARSRASLRGHIAAIHERQIAPLPGSSRVSDSMPRAEPVEPGRKNPAADRRAEDEARLRDMDIDTTLQSAAKITNTAGNIVMGALSPVPSVASRLHGGDPGAGGYALDVAGILPIVRGPRAAVRGVKALQASRSASAAIRAGRASLKEAGPITQAVKGYKANRATTRTMRLGEQTTQFPKSQSLITSSLQHAGDIVSENLTPIVTKLRESDSLLERGVGKTLTPLSSRGRLPKQAGKWNRIERQRAKALRVEDVRAIEKLGGKGEQMAHFWWAQLPSQYRTPEGLTLVRNRLAAESELLASGEVLKKAQAKVAELELAAKTDPSLGFDVLRAKASLRALTEDIPHRVKDVSENIAKLDHLIQNPVKPDDRALTAVDILSGDRKQALAEAGKLADDQALNREGMVSGWLGLDPSGEELYVGHRLTKGSFNILPSAGLGRTKLPAGVGTQNRLRLISSGRARQTLEVVVEDWSQAMSYKFNNIAKDEIGKMGESFAQVVDRGQSPEALLRSGDYALVNTRGQDLPRRFKMQNDEARALEEGVSASQVHEEALKAYVNSYLGYTPEDAAKLLSDSLKAGHLADLRLVPKDVVRKYYGQFITPKFGRVSRNPAIEPARPGVVGKTANFANDVVYASLVWSNPGYIPANGVQNLLMAGLHQVAFLPVNVSRAGQLLAQAPQKLRTQVLTEAGEPATMALGAGSVLEKGQSVVSNIADAPWRVSAIIHEAARQGVISKTKPYLTPDDYKALSKWLEDPASRASLNDARDRGIQSVVDFDRLGPVERATAKKLLFVWGWIRGGSRYPFRFAADHPVRSALMTWAATGAPGAPEDVQDALGDVTPNFANKGMPSWLQHAIKFGDVEVGDKVYPRLLPTRAISPVSTAEEVWSTALARPGGQTAIEMTNPAIRSAIQVAGKQSPYGNQLPTYRDAAKQAVERLSPQFGLARDLANPPKQEETGIYPEDANRLGRLKRATRILPYAVDPKAAQQARIREGLASDAEKRQVKVDEFVDRARESGLGEPPQEVLDEMRLKLELESKIKSGDPPQKKAKLAAALYDKKNGGHLGADMVKAARTKGEMQSVYETLSSQLYSQFASWDSTARGIHAVLDSLEPIPGR